MGRGGKLIWLEVVGTEVEERAGAAGLFVLASLERLEDGQDWFE